MIEPEELPEFETLEAFPLLNRGIIHFVQQNDDDLLNRNPRTLAGKFVRLDGKRVRVQGVELPAIHWRPGSEVFRNLGLLITGEMSSVPTTYEDKPRCPGCYQSDFNGSWWCDNCSDWPCVCEPDDESV